MGRYRRAATHTRMLLIRRQKRSLIHCLAPLTICIRSPRCFYFSETGGGGALFYYFFTFFGGGGVCCVQQLTCKRFGNNNGNVLFCHFFFLPLFFCCFSTQSSHFDLRFLFHRIGREAARGPFKTFPFVSFHPRLLSV